MTFQPDHRLRFIVPLEGKHPLFGMKFFLDSVLNVMKFTLTDRGTTFDAYCVAAGGDHGGIVFSPNRSAITVTAPSNAISTVTFHLFNFPDFLVPKTTSWRQVNRRWKAGKRAVGSYSKQMAGIIAIAATDRTDDLEKALEGPGRLRPNAHGADSARGWLQHLPASNSTTCWVA